MEGAFLIRLDVTAIMTVKITVTKMDVSDRRWEESQCFILYKAHIICSIVNLSKNKEVYTKVVCSFVLT